VDEDDPLDQWASVVGRYRVVAMRLLELLA
jgi:hypothetical protein